MTCLLSNSTSRFDPRLVGVEGLVDDVVATDADGRLDRLCSEGALDGDAVAIDCLTPLDSSCQGTSAARLADAREHMSGGGGIA